MLHTYIYIPYTDTIPFLDKQQYKGTKKKYEIVSENNECDQKHT